MNREDIIAWAREAELICDTSVTTQWIEDHDLTPYLERFAALIAAAEREACAKVCEQEWNKYCEEPYGYALAVKECAAAIRARGQA